MLNEPDVYIPRVPPFVAPTIQGLFDGLGGVIKNPIWSVLRVPSSNGAVTQDGVQLVILATAAPFVGGYVGSVALNPTHYLAEMFIYDTTQLTKRIWLSPTLQTTQDPETAGADAYLLQIFGNTVGAFRFHTGVFTQIGTNKTVNAPTSFQIIVEGGIIYFNVAGVLVASETYQIAAGKVYPYFYAKLGGATPPLTADIDNLVFLSETP